MAGTTNRVLRIEEYCEIGDNRFNIRTREGEGSVVNLRLERLPPTMICADVQWELIDGNAGNAIVRNGTGCMGDLLIAHKNSQWRYTLIFRIPACTGTCTGDLFTPQNLRSTCTNATRIQLLWDPDPLATYYSLRIDSNRDPDSSLNSGVCPTAIDGPGDHCKDIPAGTTFYEFDADPYAVYTWWIHSRSAFDDYGAGTVGPTMKCTPNCSNLTGPDFIQVGQSGTFSARFESLDGNLAGEIFHLDAITHIGGMNFSDTSGSLEASWTPNASDIGAHQVCCRAWNDAKAECRPRSILPVDSPPLYQCLGSDGIGGDVCKVVSVNQPEAWYKLKDASFHRLGTYNVTIPANMQTYDGDDTAEQYPIIGSPGVFSTVSSTITVNSTNINQVSTLNWQARRFIDDNSFLASLPAFIEYARARKNARIISQVSQIQPDMINIINNPSGGNVHIFDFNELPDTGNYVLIVNGDISFGIPVPPINPALNAVAIIAAGTIRIDPAYSELNGIFIADSFDLASGVTTTTNPLKINGNLISRIPINNMKRDRTDTTRPSLFVVFNPRMYIELLPLLSTIVHEGRQIR